VLLDRLQPITHQEHEIMSHLSLSFETIDLCFLAGVSGGQGAAAQPRQQARPQQPAPAAPQPNFMQRWGRNMQTGGEYLMATGAVGTVVPVVGETGIPEAVAAGGGASWLIGKGIEGIGSLFH
jgi:hypothetical protein